jgi:hypothetical protein
MPLKMQYPIKLHQDTKCPSDGLPISEIGPCVYACHGGHILEPTILVTMTPRPKQQPVKIEDSKKIPAVDTVGDGWVENDGHKQKKEVKQ